jgi:hypothetical protein
LFNSEKIMTFIQRTLFAGLIPVIVFIACQLYLPGSLHDAWDALLPYLGGSLPYHDPVFSGNPPRSETHLFISAITHWSHFEKIAKVAVAVAELGYPITLITGRIFEKEASSLHPNISFYPLQGKDDKLTEEQYAALASMPPEEAELFMSKMVLVEGMPTTHETLQQVFSKFRAQHGNDKPLLSFYDLPVTGHLPILLGAPGIRPDATFAIACHPISLDSNDTYPMRVDKVPDTGPDARAIHCKAHQDRHNDRHTRELDLTWWAKLRDMGAAQDAYPSILHAMASLPDHLMTMGVPEFEWPRTDLRSNIHYFGALKQTRHDDDTLKDVKFPSWWDDVYEAKTDGKRIVVVSQGTIETNLNDLLLPTLEALKDREDVLVIASTVIVQPEEVPGWTVRGNARATRFVPYESLLPIVCVTGKYEHSTPAKRTGRRPRQ